jgi:uncharacterized phage protein gp47/JayE
MSSTLAPPTIEELRQAFHASVRATRLRRADGRDGSVYDYLAGPSAILWSRAGQYVRDLFRAIYIDEAQGDDLTERIRALWGIDRVLDTYGPGYATVYRPTAAAGQGTFWRGTRIRVGSSYYRVREDTTVGASVLSAPIPIEATRYGAGVALTHAPGAVDDPVWDPSWTVPGVSCDDGTSFESRDAFLARARTERLDARVGYASAILTACKNAGASVVAAFPSTFAGEASDYGIGAVYVGDESFTGTPALVDACLLALERVRVLGAEIHVGAMTPAALTIEATVYLWDDPANFDQVLLTQALSGALVREFTGSTNGFSFTRDSLGGVMSRTTSAVQSAVFTTPSSDVAILTGSPPAFPLTLPRYQLSAERVLLTYAPPQ